MESPHPAATAATTQQAREGRSPLDRFAIENPGEAHRRMDELLRERGPGRDRRLREGYERAYAAFNRGDWEATTAIMDSERFLLRTAEPEKIVDLREVYEGVEGFIEYQLFVRDALSNLEMSLEELIDAGPNRLLVLQRHSAEGRGSGVPVDWQLAVLYEYREGMLVAMTVWTDREVAFRELGLPPSPARR